MANDREACVAVTGCVGSEDVEISIRSAMYDTSEFGYIWDEQGQTTEAENIKVPHVKETYVFKVARHCGIFCS